MKYFIYTSLILLITVCSVSCKSEIENNSISEIFTLPYDGDYKVVSLTANVPVDLNFDGVYSTDFLHEFSDLTDWYGTRMYDVRLTTRKYISEKTVLLTSMPYMKRYPPAYNIKETSVVISGVYGNYIYSEKANSFKNTMDIKEVLKYRDLFGVVITDLYPINQNTIFLQFEHSKIYDERDHAWKTIMVDGVFIKK